jgi:hypothetical protein
MKTIFQNDDFIIDYNEENNKYRVSYFEDNHFVDDCEFDGFRRYGHWTGMEGDVCSECYRSLTEIMDADSYFAIGFDPNQLVACPFCGARMDGGNR